MQGNYSDIMLLNFVYLDDFDNFCYNSSQKSIVKLTSDTILTILQYSVIKIAIQMALIQQKQNVGFNVKTNISILLEMKKSNVYQVENGVDQQLNVKVREIVIEIVQPILQVYLYEYMYMNICIYKYMCVYVS